MKYLTYAIIYASFFGCILGAVYFTESAWCLWALLLTPSTDEMGIESQVKKATDKLNENNP